MAQTTSTIGLILNGIHTMAINFRHKNHRGFTLMETILYVAIISIFVGGVILFSWDMVYGNVKSSVQREVMDNLRLASKKIQYEIRNASDVSINSSSSITLTSAEASRNQTLIDLNGGRIRFGYGNSGSCTYASPCYLTSSHVVVTSLTFTNLSNTGSSSKVIRFSINMRYDNNSNRKDWNYQETFTSSAETRGRQ